LLPSRIAEPINFRDSQKSLDHFDFDFNDKMNPPDHISSSPPVTSSPRMRTPSFSAPPGTGKSHLAQVIGRAVIL
jgi:DNA replication protein DnaC